MKWLKKLWEFLTNWKKKKKKKETAKFPESVRNNGADVSGWKQGCTIANVRWESPGIRWDYADEGNRANWPVFSSGGLNGHLCVLIQGADGKRRQCYVDSLRGKNRAGWDHQTLSPFKTHGNKIKSPLKGWAAKKGERLGIYIVSTGWGYPDKGVHERSNVVWTEYPY